MPAAAVIRRMRALSGIIGRKAFVGGYLSLLLNTTAQLLTSNMKLNNLSLVGEEGTPGVVVKYVDIGRNTSGESALLGQY